MHSEFLSNLSSISILFLVQSVEISLLSHNKKLVLFTTLFSSKGFQVSTESPKYHSIFPHFRRPGLATESETQFFRSRETRRQRAGKASGAIYQHNFSEGAIRRKKVCFHRYSTLNGSVAFPAKLFNYEDEDESRNVRPATEMDSIRKKV